MERVKIADIIERLLEQSGTKAKVKLERSFPGGRLVGGKYQIGSHTITMYYDVIKKQCEQLFSHDVNYLDYFSIVLAHEIGHAEDQELEILCKQLEESKTQLEKNKIALKIEENAWNYAQGLLQKIDDKVLQLVIYYSLQPYREKLQMEIA